ncbi:hypothetical protein Tco_1545817 [Tanacetum coccineum]
MCTVKSTNGTSSSESVRISSSSTESRWRKNNRDAKRKLRCWCKPIAMMVLGQNRSSRDLWSRIKSVDEEPIVNTNTQPEVVTPFKPDDISLPIRRTSGRVSKPPQFYYGFYIEEDMISDSTLSELDEPANCKEAMASSEAAKWKEAMKSEIQSMYDN